MTGVRVLITGVGGAAVGNQVLKALRLVEPRHQIVVADASPDNLRMSGVERTHVLPLAREAHYMDEVLRICGAEGIQALIPGSEPELSVLVRNREKIAAAGVVLLANRTTVIEQCMNKIETCRFLEAHGFRSPKSKLIRSEAEIEAPCEFPLVLKPTLDSGGSKNVFLVQDEEELRLFARYLLRGGCAVMVQEYVGTPSEEYTVGVLTGLDGEFLGSIALRRYVSDGLSLRLSTPNRTGRKELGSNLVVSSGFSHGHVDDYPDVRRKCEEIAAALDSRGPLNIQCRRAANGDIVPFEINPRFSGTATIRALVGFNEADALLRREVGGERISPLTYRKGTVLRSLKENVVSLESENVPAETAAGKERARTPA